MIIIKYIYIYIYIRIFHLETVKTCSWFLNSILLFTFTIVNLLDNNVYDLNIQYLYIIVYIYICMWLFIFHSYIGNFINITQSYC